MNKDNFEELLVDNIIKSLETEPYNWETSILGLKRTYDEFELNIHVVKSIDIYRPYKYEFKNKELEGKLYDAAYKLWKIYVQDSVKKKDIENMKNLSDFLKLDTRKNKLKELNKIQENEVKKSIGNFWRRFSKHFGLK